MTRILPFNFFKNLLKNFPLTICFLLAANLLPAQIKFRAVCNNTSISKNEYIHVQFVVENASKVEQIVPPSLAKFVVISGPNQQSSVTSINGATRQSVAIEYILKPRQPGNIKLEPALAKIDGKIIKSNILTINVSNVISGSTPGTSISSYGSVTPSIKTRQFDDYILRKGENLPEKIRKNLFVKVEVNKTSCYVGESIIATYKLYTRLKSESNLTKSPSFNGFSVSELDLQDNDLLSTEKLNGKEYSVYTLRKVQLYPLQAGNIELEPVEVENRVTFLKGEYADQARGDIFVDVLKDFAGSNSPGDAVVQQKIILASIPVNISVTPLPGNQPETFKGAVGRFAMVSSVQKNKISTDESVNLKISISGVGNLPMINAPDIQWPKGIEAFEPVLNESINKQAIPLTGQKSFTYPFTADKQGTYQVPPIQFTFFDVSSKSYKTLSSAPITIDVKKGNAIRKIIRPFIKKNDQTLFSNPSFWMLLGSIILIGLALIFFTQNKKEQKKADQGIKKNSVSSVDQNPATSLAKNPLNEAEGILQENDPQKFYQTLNRCLRNFIGEKFGLPANVLSKKKIIDVLDKNNVSVVNSVMVTSLIEEIELNLYAPVSSASQMQQTYAKASEVVALLEKQVISSM